MEKSLKLTKVKRMVLAVLTVSFLLGVPITSYAASYTLKTLRCPKCGSYNKSYGYDENYGSYTVSVPGGNYCEACHQMVPEGEYHIYYYTTDLYYFLCNGKCRDTLSIPDCVYTMEYKNVPTGHHISN